MTISLCVIAYNEEDTLEHLFMEICNQDYAHDKMEIVLIDSSSTDGTKALMKLFEQEHRDEFYSIQVLDNPQKILPCGWNVALSHFSCDIILRVDAHASIGVDFVSKNVEDLKLGEDVVGGYRPNIIQGETPGKKLLLLAESSMFGSSIASYRRNPGKSYVDSVFHGAYRRTVFETVGGYNEYLARTEDNEMHYRMRKAGYKLCFDPDIISYQHTRPSLKGMLKQKYANGYWIGLTSGVCPGCLSFFHFVPFCFVLGIVVTTILALCHIPWLAILMWGLYGILAVVMAIASVIPERKHIIQLTLPFLFFLLHISYGIGTTWGLLKMPWWRRTHKVCPKVDEIKEQLKNG